MKLQSIYILASVIILMAFASCKKDLLKTNTDPNSVSVDVFDPNNILTAAMLYYTGSTNNAIEVEETEMEGAGCMIQHFASTSGTFFGDKYLLSPGGWSSFYDNVYTQAVKNAVDLYSTTSGKAQYKNLHQISRIVKVMIFQRITDVYGDVPYFQAGLGYHSSIFFPAYDKQQDIYTDMLKEVSQAVDSLDENADKPIGDLFYSGQDDQIPKWKRFGNSLLLRIAMRLTKVDPTTAQKYVKQVQGLTMTSDDDNAIIAHDDTDPLSINRIFRGIGEDGAIQMSWQMSKTFVDTLKNNKDPRLPIYGYFWDPSWAPPLSSTNPAIGTADTAQIHGLPNGYDNSTGVHGLIHFPGYLGNINLYARANPIIFNATAPTLVLTYAETELLLADAAQRWGIGAEDAATAYTKGVTAAMTELSAFGDGGTISGSDIAAYLAAHPYKPTNGLNMINTQYWITTFFDEYEAWSNYRRTGFPLLTPIAAYTGSQSPGAIPRRMQYSTNDKQVNSTNYNIAVSRLSGGDKITSRFWWDQ